MSLSCFRSLPGRLSSLVNGRKPSSRLDRHRLREHVESSVFLKQFLGTQRALSLRANTADKPSIPYRQDVVGNDKNNSFLDNNRLSSLENLYSWESNIDRNILLTSDDKNILKTSPQPSPLQDNEGKPSQEQLQSIVDTLSKDLPNLFVKPQNFSIYTKDFIFINNIRGVTTRGITDYAKQLILLRVIGHIRFAHVKLNILKLTTHSDDGTIKIRWRIRGVTGWKVISMFWRYKIWKIQDAIDAYHDIWYDGFSTYYINGDGKVYKHVADKVMPDQDIVAKKDDLRMAPKLALFKNLLDNATRTSLN
ncbi:uncharacterized protein LOC105249594 isoform X2 [Camponotus floridanus]|uniref:uncharacterized protein LOC105249594 isoform X2 n=1 Tax=Camponotus floridanus TaxID=104421 RepID=UPI00059D4147|nr:uncharacterized protein LOC105249594 isoform X2 [Camponotus floridanus]